MVLVSKFHDVAVVVATTTISTTTTNDPFRPLFETAVRRTHRGGVCRTWDPPDNHDLREAQLAHQPFVNKVELGVVLRKDAARRIARPTG